jgi:hypothetical protein
MNKMWITQKLRITLALFACSSAFAANAQYYYKDIVVTGQINANYLVLRNNNVTHVALTPSALDPTQKLVTLEQTVYPKQNLVVTYTKVPDAPESWLKSYHDASGRLIRTVDSSADVVSTSVYEYGSSDRLTTISSSSVPVNDPTEKEVHKWIYNDKAQPVQLLKIKNDNDTTFFSFVFDEHGNVGEEKAVRKGNASPSTFYYYDADNRLTDIARFNEKANRILPSYMFEYNSGLQLSKMIIVPAGSNDYQTWKYVYNEKGLKQKDLCYSKQKEMVASIEYVYTFK